MGTFDSQRRISILVVLGTFAGLRGIRPRRHEVAHLGLFGVMGTFAILRKSFQCARKTWVSMTQGGVGTDLKT